MSSTGPAVGGAGRAPRELEAGGRPRRAYGAIHAWMARYLRVPDDPPALPEGDPGDAVSFRPSATWLRYLKVSYLLVVGVSGLVMGGLGLVALVAMTQAGNGGVALVLGALVGGVLVALALWSWWAIQLRYDTTWYAMTDRALRTRTGIWLIREHTITFENVQNVRVRRGPLQRWMGIGDVAIETAAAGAADSQDGTTSASGATIRGVDDPAAIRDRIVARMRDNRNSGLGDPPHGSPPPPRRQEVAPAWGEAHLQVLREIRAEVGRLPGG